MSDNPLNLPEQLAITPTQLNSLYNKGYDQEVSGEWDYFICSAPDVAEIKKNIQIKAEKFLESLGLSKENTRFVIENTSLASNANLNFTLTPIHISIPENC